MLRNKTTADQAELLEVAEVTELVRNGLGADVDVDVPEQHPVSVGSDLYYRVMVTNRADGATELRHVVISRGESGQPTASDLVDVTYTLNPFHPAISINPKRVA